MMRKYYQLTLALVCFVSIVFLLFYRHEYYRLRYVLEVLNFFGKPGLDMNQPNVCLPSNITTQEKTLHNYPLPVWQRLTNSHYVYSAFWELTDKDRRVIAISVGVDEREPDLELGCRLWYEAHAEPVLAHFSFSKKVKDMKQRDPGKSINIFSYDLYCRPIAKDIDGIPHGVSFYKTNVNALNSIVFIPVHYSRPRTSNVTAVCVAPTAKQNLHATTAVEFVSYYHIVGVSEFMVYDSGPMSKIVSSLSDYDVKEKLKFGISAIPWNFPFSEAYSFALSVIQQDCLMRFKGKVQSVVTLNWDQYIVPKLHKLLPSMLGDLSKTASSFKVMVATFCTQLPESGHSSGNRLLRKINFVSEPDQYVNIFQPGRVRGNLQRILPGIAIVHQYSQCSENQLLLAKENTDSSILKFSGDLDKSKVFNAWRSGHI